MIATGTPQARVVEAESGFVLEGYACTNCQFRSVGYVRVCPICESEVVQRSFAAVGAVWSFTRVRIPHGDRAGGYLLLYIDIDDGPRLLCHAEDGIDFLPIGERVAVVSLNQFGDPVVKGTNRGEL